MQHNALPITCICFHKKNSEQTVSALYSFHYLLLFLLLIIAYDFVRYLKYHYINFTMAKQFEFSTIKLIMKCIYTLYNNLIYMQENNISLRISIRLKNCFHKQCVCFLFDFFFIYLLIYKPLLKTVNIVRQELSLETEW